MICSDCGYVLSPFENDCPRCKNQGKSKVQEADAADTEDEQSVPAPAPALVPCSGCGHAISPLAAACPRCGHPVNVGPVDVQQAPLLSTSSASLLQTAWAVFSAILLVVALFHFVNAYGHWRAYTGRAHNEEVNIEKMLTEGRGNYFPPEIEAVERQSAAKMDADERIYALARAGDGVLFTLPFALLLLWRRNRGKKRRSQGPAGT